MTRMLFISSHLCRPRKFFSPSYPSQPVQKNSLRPLHLLSFSQHIHTKQQVTLPWVDSSARAQWRKTVSTRTSARLVGHGPANCSTKETPAQTDHRSSIRGICISRLTPAISDSSRRSSCLHLVYRRDFVARIGSTTASLTPVVLTLPLTNSSLTARYLP